jgi:ankyrin repeat protein
VYCQVVYICGLKPARIRHALSVLPKTLDETYQRTLREINEEEWEMAHRVFQFIAVARRPLNVKELADLLAFEFEAGSNPKFREDWRLEDPVDAVLSTCSTFLTIVDDEYQSENVIQFSHFSVREFLTSSRLAKESDTILHRYHLSMTAAHTLAAQVCLSILLHLERDVVTRDSLEEFPLAKYAAEYWVEHARLEDVMQNVEDVMKQLFDPSKPHLAVCIWIRDPYNPWHPKRQAGRPLPFCGTPLHYAAFWGLQSMTEFLVIEHLQDVNFRADNLENMTPMHLVSRNGHAKVAHFLLERGANVTAQDKHGSTPLHVASQYGQPELARMLIEHGADVTAQVDRSTPLHLALQFGQPELARMLIEHGADVTAQDDGGWTPLHLASQSGQPELARMLIEHGADVTAQKKDGSTPLHLVSTRYWPHISPQRYAEVACILLKHGADLTGQDVDGRTPLDLASSDQRLAEVAGVLLQHGLDHGGEHGLEPIPRSVNKGTSSSSVVTVNPSA